MHIELAETANLQVPAKLLSMSHTFWTYILLEWIQLAYFIPVMKLIKNSVFSSPMSLFVWFTLHLEYSHMHK